MSAEKRKPIPLRTMLALVCLAVCHHSGIASAQAKPSQADHFWDGRIDGEAMLAHGSDAKDHGQTALALEDANQALRIFTDLGDRSKQAAALCLIGKVLTVTGNPGKSLETLRKSLLLRRELNDRAGQAESLTAIGDALNAEGRQKNALLYLQQALVLARNAKDRGGEAASLTGLGVSYDGLGKFQTAIDQFNHALVLWRAVHDQIGEAAVLGDLAATEDDAGHADLAMEYYQKAIDLDRTIGNLDDEAANLSNMGGHAASAGDPEKALSLYERALALEREVGNRNNAAITLHAIGLVYQSIGQPQKAQDLYNQALAIERQTGNRKSEAGTLGNIAGISLESGQLEEALKLYVEVAAIQHRLGDLSDEAFTLTSMGWVYFKLGNPQRAREFYDLASRIEKGIKAPRSESYTRWGYGLLERKEALRDLITALHLAQSTENLDLHGAVNGSLMDQFQKSSQPETAILFGKQAVNDFQTIRGHLGELGNDAAAFFLRSKKDTYRTLAQLLVEQGRISEAETVIGMLKEQEYYEFTRGGSYSDTSNQPISMTDAEQRAQSVTAAELRWIALERLGTGRNPAQQREFESLEKTLTHANAQFETKLERILAVPDLHKTVKADTSAMQNILEAVSERSPNTVGIFTLVLEKELEIFLVTRNLRVARTVSIARKDLNAKVEEFRSQLQDPCSDPRPAAEALYNLLFLPIQAELAGAKANTIVWELDGVLRYIPVSALYDGHSYIAQTYNTVLFSAANENALTSQVNVQGWRALGMGSSLAHGDLKPLTTVPLELEGIIHDTADALANGPVPGKILLDDNFTPLAMKSELRAGFPIVHIASHFVLKPGSDQSYLVLGASDTGQPGSDRLTFAQIRDSPSYKFRNVQLLTLSACETGTGGGAREQDGKEIDALGDLAASNGAKSVIATLWPVSDASTGTLMIDFYQHWTVKNTTKVEALRQAQLDMLHESAPVSTRFACKVSLAHPYYWAPFILIGNWE